MKNIMKAKRAVKKALEIQKNGGGFSLVEILSPCPTIMKMDPVVARHWVGDTLVKAFPLGVFRDRKPELPAGPKIPLKTVAEVLGAENGEAERACQSTPSSHSRVNGKDCRLRRSGYSADGTVAG